jgi:hypothetical protein
MRSKLNKVLRTEFERRLKNQLPSFKLYKEAIVPPTCYVYCQPVNASRWVFITLVISPKDDSFTVEIGWSNDGFYPQHYNYFARQINSAANTRLRLSNLIDERSDYWWYLSKKKSLDDEFFSFQEDSLEESMLKIDPALNQVFEQLNKFAIPCFSGKSGDCENFK